MIMNQIVIYLVYIGEKLIVRGLSISIYYIPYLLIFEKVIKSSVEGIDLDARVEHLSQHQRTITFLLVASSVVERSY